MRLERQKKRPGLFSPMQGMKEFQLRFKTAVNGRITINSDNVEIYSKKINTLPERRVLIPMPVLNDSQKRGNLRITYIDDV